MMPNIFVILASALWNILGSVALQSWNPLGYLVGAEVAISGCTFTFTNIVVMIELEFIVEPILIVSLLTI